MFAGEFPCKLDDKGRFAVPATLRDRFTLPGATRTSKKRRLVKSQQEPCRLALPPAELVCAARTSTAALIRAGKPIVHALYGLRSRPRSILIGPVGSWCRASYGTMPASRKMPCLVGMYDRIELWGLETWRTHLSQLEDEHEMALGKVLQLPSIKPPFPGEPSHL